MRATQAFILALKSNSNCVIPFSGAYHYAAIGLLMNALPHQFSRCENPFTLAFPIKRDIVTDENSSKSLSRQTVFLKGIRGVPEK